MHKVLWITDGVQWGWDTRARVIGAHTPHFEHIVTTFKDKCYMELKIEIEEINPDIIVNFAPIVMRGIPEKYHPYTVLCLSGFRTLQNPEELNSPCPLVLN